MTEKENKHDVVLRRIQVEEGGAEQLKEWPLTHSFGIS